MLPLGNIIRKHGVSFHCYADDTQLYISSRPGETHQIEKVMECIVDIKNWMTSNFYLREVGPPPSAKRRQNSLNRLCSVCAGLCCKKISLCCFGFLDIKIIFIGHSEVTQPPPHTPNDPQIVSFVCASFVLVCAGKSLICAASVFKILDIEL